MKTLIGIKMNWGLYGGFAILIFILFPGLGIYSYIGILVFLHQIMLLFYSLDYVIPIRYIFGTLMCLQMFIGPALSYGGFDQYQYSEYRMQVPEEVYFSYALPAVLSFIVGLHLTAGKLRGEVPDEKALVLFLEKNKDLPYWFIGIGFASSFAAGFFSSDLAFVFYLLGNFKFIGLFLLILGGRQLKILPLVIVYGSVIGSSLVGGMFHDLMTWLIMTGAVLAIRYKPSIKVKAIVTFSFILFTIILQQIKGDYRTALGQGEESGTGTFAKVYEQNQKQGSFFNPEQLAQSSVRINQGFIITYILKTVPAQEPFANGDEMLQILEAAVLPRILDPGKLTAGDHSVFYKYSHIPLRQGTSMGLSSVGDAYVNFGLVGGCIFMLILGLFYSEVLNLFSKYGKEFPILLLFTTLVFYYPIRPDCELQTILGHLVKSCFLIFIVLQFWKKDFRLLTANTWKRSLS